MDEFSTPMMQQYKLLKEQYPDCLLFFRLGDFYELFLEDAHTGARVLNITLTGRPRGKDGRIPMAGVPYHAVDTYLAKLIKAGYKVAICEQVSLPNKNGLVEREVVRVVTPGTVLDENSLNKKEHNFIISLDIDGATVSLSAADISTGYFATTEIVFDHLDQVLKDELSQLNPVECILPENLYNNPEVLKLLKSQKNLNIYPFLEWDNFASRAKDFLKEHFQISTLAGFGIEQKPLAHKTAAALLGYLKATQKNTVSHIKKITHFNEQEHLLLDKSTILNLELFSTIREHDTRGSLLNVLDQTITPMGGRMLKEWLSKPLLQKEQIEKRLDAVDELKQNKKVAETLQEHLKQIPDIERILSRLSVGLGNARDLINIKNALQATLTIKKDLKEVKSLILKEHLQLISSDLKKVIKLIDENITDEPPIDLKIGNLIKSGVNEKLDALRQKVDVSQDWIQRLEKEEKEKTGISSLKVRFNKVFGFYIEVSNSNLSSVPANYMRKQTLVNGERFITPELKHHEEIVLSAQEKIYDLEYELFLQRLQEVLTFTGVLQDAAAALAVLDCLNCFSTIAQVNQYVRPKLLYSGEIKIKNGRHPVVEKLLEDKQFVPNDITFDHKHAQVLVITGPNMAGKSVFIRQVALLSLMAQIGCFVPAESAQISIVDRIFVRSGASDVITSGLSTFMVEMVETAYILHHATEKSLIIMDEIGRGTSTYDGISIAWAIAEYLVTHYKIPPKTLFATHYHELQKLEEVYPKNIKNFSMAVTEQGGNPIFLHTITPGGASSSFGIAVAKLAGVPYPVIKKAEEKLEGLEAPVILASEERARPESNSHSVDPDRQPTVSRMTQDERLLRHSVPRNDEENILEHLLIRELETLDISTMTPLEALNKLADIKSKIKIVQNAPDDFLEVN